MTTIGKHEAAKAKEAPTTGRTNGQDEDKAAQAIPRRGSSDDRVEAVRLALEAHRGKGMSADAVVREAAIFERYLIEGAAAPATDAGLGQPVDAGMPKAT